MNKKCTRCGGENKNTYNVCHQCQNELTPSASRKAFNKSLDQILTFFGRGFQLFLVLFLLYGFFVLITEDRGNYNIYNDKNLSPDQREALDNYYDGLPTYRFE